MARFKLSRVMTLATEVSLRGAIVSASRLDLDPCQAPPRPPGPERPGHPASSRRANAGVDDHCRCTGAAHGLPPAQSQAAAVSQTPAQFMGSILAVAVGSRRSGVTGRRRNDGRRRRLGRLEGNAVADRKQIYCDCCCHWVLADALADRWQHDRRVWRLGTDSRDRMGSSPPSTITTPPRPQSARS